MEDIQSGQLFLAYHSKKNSHLMPLNLFSLKDNKWFTYKEEFFWEIGDELKLRGPIGEGFRAIRPYQNLLLIDLENEIQSLYSLMEEGLNSGKNVVYSAKETNFPIPSSVEIMPLELSQETIRWADFIAVEVNRDDLQKFSNLFFQIRELNIDCDVLVHCPILCSGKSECMVCAIKTKRGWVKTCQNGQVIKLDQLEIE